MNISFIVHNSTTGEILRTGSCPGDMIEIQVMEKGESVIEGNADDLTQYIDIINQTVVDKPAHPATINKVTMLADQLDRIIITNLPNPTTVIFCDTFYEVTDGDFDFTIDTPGEYKIICQSFPYLDKEFTINAS